MSLEGGVVLVGGDIFGYEQGDE